MAKVQKSTDSSGLAEVVDRILDKGIVIDAWVKGTLGDFVSDLRATVAGVRKEFAADFAGAHRAWSGTMTAAMAGRTRRGGKWFGGESA